MLIEAYIEALLVDEELADQVWRLWDADVIDDELAAIAWLLLRVRPEAALGKLMKTLSNCTLAECGQ